MNNIPIIRDTDAILASDCCPRPDGQKELHRVPRQAITRPISNQSVEEVLQDEAEFPILDEITNHYIFDNWKA